LENSRGADGYTMAAQAVMLIHMPAHCTGDHQRKTMSEPSIHVSASLLRTLLREQHPVNYMAFTDLFAVGCLLHAQGQQRAGRKLIEQVFDAVRQHGNKLYLAALMEEVSGNELRLADEVFAHEEINELLAAHALGRAT
jgi:hypothetical protein